MTLLRFVLFLLMGGLLLVAASTVPQAYESDNGVLVRVGGDAHLSADDRANVIVVVGGSLQMDGSAAEVVVVVDGTVHLRNARVQEVVAVDGAVTLEGQTLVDGRVHLAQASLTQDETSVVRGTINRDAHLRIGRGLFFFGVVVAVGYSIAMLLGGLALVAVAGHRVQEAGAVLSSNVTGALLAALILWIGLPAGGIALIPTLIGLPTGLAVLVFVLPALALGGYLTFGVWLGDVLLRRMGWGTGRYDRYRAVLLGVLVLLVAGSVPMIGAAVPLLAAFVGSGALGFSMWEAAPWRASAASSAAQTV